MSPMPDEEVQRRLKAVTERMIKRSHRELIEVDVTPPRPMPAPASSAPPPAPWQDREPGEDDT